MLKFERPQVEWTRDGALIVRKTQPSLDDAKRALFVAAGLGSLVLMMAVPVWHTWTASTGFRLTPGQTALTLAAMGLIVAFGRDACRATYRRSTLWVWRIDPVGVEFCRSNGVVRSLRWDEVARVGWYQRTTIRLIGRDTRLTLRPEGIQPTEWQPVRDRLELLLKPRFDLTVAAPVVVPTSPLRIAGVALGAVLSVLASFGLVLLDAGRWGMVFVGGWGFVLGAFMIGYMGVMIRDDYRRTWRTPRDPLV